MCGINGLIGFTDCKEIIHSMNEALRHRGPDADGEWFDKNVALGHRRLSIIDLSAEANQPFIKDNLVIVYNGETYNFLELKDELIERGVRFRTRSDTEVILELFRAYRVESFNRLVGMFAFCIYDINTKELFLVRDYFGIKPLYYAAVGSGKLAFSSELKALVLLPEVKREINPLALVSCINYLWIYGNDSIFKDIKKIPPAHYLYLRLNGGRIDVEIKKYWELEVKNLVISEAQVKEQLKSVLEKSVKRHLISDVPVGGFLSGGIDSSLISAIAKKFNNDLSTYTISMDEKDKRVEKMPDDNFYAKRIASLLNINHRDIPVKPAVMENLELIVYFLDEPIGDPAAINTYLISKVARDNGIKVLLSGMGADEIFAGYRRQYATLLAERLNNMNPYLKRAIKTLVRPMPVRVGNQGIRQIRWMKRFLSFMDMPVDLAYMRSYSYYDKEELCGLFNNQFNREIEEMYEAHRDIFYKMKGFDLISRMCYTDINMFMIGLNLAYTDRASMAASVEVRVPFIDKEMIEFALSIEGGLKIKNRVSKYILKEVARDYLPRDIVYRPKASFSMPIRAWISNELRGMVNDILSPSMVKKRGLFDYDYIKRIIYEDEKGIEDNAYRIYQLLTLELWCKRFIDG